MKKYYRKFYYMKCISSTKHEPIKIPFSIRKLMIFFLILVLINVLEYTQNTKETFLSDKKVILLKIKIPCDG